ncbi:lipopolysaccharide-induced tumor necrosis factor-alpha factor homolog isoform X1 [Colossoma macropomum]|uniref:lipopolysaccharide-induced tumor necrosis factor-alpha factor homolog isoform X1 n=2 Tax=Colossoma macropomum TaxID=42526 RepID=UPI0018645366|nr:lipopolysaccharide-induced tumor necrosis factor-alpha factor homolog isoform X1 [Colossoma macropomum]XP_036413336.1 lipopolysaccharide-induced tumor necrosis factor-alpha factor homolog isoform X1 [Colossoma macropomum]
MDVPQCSSARSMPPPPSYAEASQCPAYMTGPATPSTPPPSYGEAVSASNEAVPSPFPVLTIPTEITTVHQTQQVFVQQTIRSSPPQVFVVSQQETHRRHSRRRLLDRPTVINCPYCHQNITTTVEYKPGAGAWGMCFLFILLGFICGCCLIPFCVTAFQDVHHSCPHCSKHIGIYVR